MSETKLILNAIRDLKTDNKDEHKTLFELFAGIGDRTRSLENWRAYIVGGLSVMSIVFGVLTTVIIRKIF